LRLGFAGTPEFAVPALDALANLHRICAVFTQPDRAAGRGRLLHSGPVKIRALQLGIPVYQPAGFDSPDVLDTLRGLELDALVVVAYGLILPRAALCCPKQGCINIHASLLPRWRGAAPIQRAVLAGDAATGITIMRMEAGLDTGPILSARSVRIGPRDTAKILHDRLARVGAELMVETLRRLSQGDIHAVPQPAAGVTYASKIDKAEAAIDWRDDAELIERRVRAFNAWPIAETRLDGAQLRIFEAEIPHPAPLPPLGGGAVPGTVLAASPEGIDIACGRGVLRILRLQLAGRKALDAKEFLQGQRLGARLGPA